MYMSHIEAPPVNLVLYHRSVNIIRGTREPFVFVVIFVLILSYVCVNT